MGLGRKGVEAGWRGLINSNTYDWIIAAAAELAQREPPRITIRIRNRSRVSISTPIRTHITRGAWPMRKK